MRLMSCVFVLFLSSQLILILLILHVNVYILPSCNTRTHHYVCSSTGCEIRIGSVIGVFQSRTDYLHRRLEFESRILHRSLGYMRIGIKYGTFDHQRIENIFGGPLRRVRFVRVLDIMYRRIAGIYVCPYTLRFMLSSDKKSFKGDVFL